MGKTSIKEDGKKIRKVILSKIYCSIRKNNLIGKQKDKPISCSSKESSRANRAVWTKNHPRRDNTWAPHT